MPTYEYYCERNGRTVEVSHRMAELLDTWGELCARAGLPLQGTPASSPVQKLISGAAVISGKGAAGAAEMPPCAMGGACCGGGCSIES